MRRAAVLLLACLAFVGVLAGGLVGCASAPPAPLPEPPWRDALFGSPAEPPPAEAAFALSAPMQRYLREHVAPHLRSKGRQQALLDALVHDGRLRLEYDGASTRTAAEAFDARAGNCLSLVLMTSAFAKALGLQVEYHSAWLEATWSRQGDLLLRSGHVNVTLGQRATDAGARHADPRELTIDFLPPAAVRGLRTRVIDEATVLAMYMSNRAAEALLADRLDDAYAWARAAIRHHPGFPGARNTLAVLYLRRGDVHAAEAVLRGVLAREPDNTRALANLALALEAQGRTAEAHGVRGELARHEAVAPFHHYAQGLDALQRRDYAGARDAFRAALAQHGDRPEVHHGLAQAYLQLGDPERARRHLAQAVDASGSPREREAYASKLAWLRSLQGAGAH